MSAPEEVNYTAFVDHEDIKPQNERLNLDQSNSMFAKKQPAPTQDEFKKSVSEQVANQNELFKEVQSATKQYWALVKSKILPDNKEQQHVDLESRSIGNLINLASKLNANQELPEGIGSVGVCQLLLQVCLYQRDAINALSYKVQQLETASRSKE